MLKKCNVTLIYEYKTHTGEQKKISGRSIYHGAITGTLASRPTINLIQQRKVEKVSSGHLTCHMGWGEVPPGSQPDRVRKLPGLDVMIRRGDTSLEFTGSYLYFFVTSQNKKVLPWVYF